MRDEAFTRETERRSGGSAARRRLSGNGVCWMTDEEAEVVDGLIKRNEQPAGLLCECGHFRAAHTDGPCLDDECGCRGYITPAERREEATVRAGDGSGDRVGVMLRVAGNIFACECGANVFSKMDGEYRCNGCERRYA